MALTLLLIVSTVPWSVYMHLVWMRVDTTTASLSSMQLRRFYLLYKLSQILSPVLAVSSRER